MWNDLKGRASNAPKIAELTKDAARAAQFSARAGDMLYDFSKTSIDADAMQALLAVASNAGVEARRDAMFAGAKINETEDRAVLHTALRNLTGTPVMVDGEDVMPGVLATLERMKSYANALRAEGRITDVVNIGIGGSDLGPVMATLALAPYHDGPKTHFVSNVDGAHIHDALKDLNPATTLVIVASKTFTTIETITNATTAKKWLQTALGDDVSANLAALSTAEDKTAAFGIPNAHVFGFEDWVGGRYSLWGPIGLSIMLAVGPDDFEDFLRGAEAMDNHFRDAAPAENLPMLLALVGLWHSHACGYSSRAVLPYDQRLLRLAAYFQQLEMESNGKGVAMDGTSLPYESGPIVWGEPGTNGQHAFYQLIHQGTRVVPCEFLVAAEGHEADLAHQHTLLLANCLAQSEALMLGRSLEKATELMAAKGLAGAELERQARHRVFTGDRPSTTLIYPKLTPFVLGQILALYEHRVFVEGVILGINSFDQWGVELGKELAVAITPLVAGTAKAEEKDSSTQMLLAFIHAHR